MPNLELLALIAISWILIWFFEKGNLSVLGLRPTKSRLKYAAILFTVTAICCLTGFLMRMYFAKEEFGLNPKANLAFVLSGIWLTLSSVLFEELLCRGVGLYILIKKLGQNRAILISSVIFGMLHWLNDGVWGNAQQMLIVFAYTFSFGLVFGYAFAKSRSIYLPIAMHFGWNLVQNFIFPDGPTGNTILVSSSQPIVTISYLVFFIMLLFPKIAAIIVDYFILKTYRRTVV